MKHSFNLPRILVLPLASIMIFFSLGAPRANALIFVPTNDAMLNATSLEHAGFQDVFKMGADTIMYAIGQQLLTSLTDSTVNWIKGGFNGSPAFAVDPTKLFLDTANMVSGGLANLGRRPRGLFQPFGFGLLNKCLLMMVLLCAFLSVNVAFSAGTIIAGFSFGHLFTIVSITPAGIGVVEALMPVALRSLRVDWSQAVIITLVYRALTFWLPLGIGALAFRSLERTSDLK